MISSFANQPLKQSHLTSDAQQYTSEILRLFLQHLKRQDESCVLDAGPVIDNNINFLARRVTKLFICDMLTRFKQHRQKHSPAKNVWQDLDYPDGQFDGILLWNIIDHIENRLVTELARICSRMMKPKGLLMVIAQDVKNRSSRQTFFTINENSKLCEHPFPDAELPTYRRENREIFSLMEPLSSAKSYIYRNGSREHLFQR
ncbi:MAG: class I SAM-dependent methyltransferase [Desulfobacterales bacterium]